MEQHQLFLSLPSVSQALADREIADLQAFLQNRIDAVSLERSKANRESQEIGSILVAAFATPAIVELAKGIADWMRKRNLVVSLSPDGSSHVEGPPDKVETLVRDILATQRSRTH